MEYLTLENYSTLIQNAKQPVLIDFYADWCGPCKMLSPIMSKLAQEHPEVSVVKCDVDKNQELAMKFGVRSIPTVVAMKNGVEVNRKIGLTNEKVYLGLL